MHATFVFNLQTIINVCCANQSTEYITNCQHAKAVKLSIVHFKWLAFSWNCQKMNNVFISAVHEYASACLPQSSSSYTNLCYVYIISESTANVDIHTYVDSISFTLSPGELYIRQFDDEFFPTNSSEKKAIRVTSDVPLQMLLYKTRLHSTSPYHQDVYMVPNQAGAQNRYFTTGYPRTQGTGCDSNPEQFYLVSSFHDGTFVNVTQQDGITYEVELPEYGTFFQTTTDRENHLAAGTLITSSKPINVISGNLCITNAVSGANSDTYASSIPPTEVLGTEYIVPNIINSYSPYGYSIGVVATEDNTTIMSAGDMYILDQGESATLEYPSRDGSVYITCSKPCLVAQYTKNYPGRNSLFMQTILPEDDFSLSAFLTTMEANASTAYLSLVLKEESAGNNLYLNGVSLGYLTWTPTNGYSTSELAISQGTYELISEDGRPFAMYIYFHMQQAGAGSGYGFLPLYSMDISSTPEPTTAPTTAPTTSAPLTAPTTTVSPSINGTLPQHTARVNGTAYTADGEDMTPQCAIVRQSLVYTKLILKKY